MNTVINNPPSNGDSGGANTGLVIAVIVIIAAVLIGLFFMYGLPELRRIGDNAEDDGSSINIPDKIDINVNSGGDNGGGDQPQ